MLVGYFSLTYVSQKPVSKQFYKFNCPYGKQKFFKYTNDTSQFTKGFERGQNFDEKCSRFFRSLKSTIFKSLKELESVEEDPNTTEIENSMKWIECEQE